MNETGSEYMRNRRPRLPEKGSDPFFGGCVETLIPEPRPPRQNVRMTTASRNDILRIFPDLPDHAVSKIEDMQATVAELDAALLMLSADEEELIERKQREGNRLNHLMAILNQAGVEAPDDDR